MNTVQSAATLVNQQNQGYTVNKFEQIHSGHMGPFSCEQTDMTKSMTFPHCVVGSEIIKEWRISIRSLIVKIVPPK